MIRAMSALELKIPPPVVALAVALLMWLGVRAFPRGPLSFPGDVPLAVNVAFLGVLCAIAGAVAFRRAGTTVNPMRPDKTSALVTAGIYRYTRNPMYLGLLLVLAGWALGLGYATALFGPVAFAAYIHRFQIAPEERVLRARFGAEWQDYAGRVRPWL